MAIATLRLVEEISIVTLLGGCGNETGQEYKNKTL